MFNAVQLKTEPNKTLDNLAFLPSYARFILTDRLEQYVREQIRLSQYYRPPLMKFLQNMDEKELFELGKKTSTEFLTYLSNNQARKQIEDSVINWRANRLPSIDKNDIAAEDITLVNYIRKTALQHFIPEYCSDTYQVISLIKEIDLFFVEAETASANTYLQILTDPIEEHSPLCSQVNNP